MLLRVSFGGIVGVSYQVLLRVSLLSIIGGTLSDILHRGYYCECHCRSICGYCEYYCKYPYGYKSVIAGTIAEKFVDIIVGIIVNILADSFRV